jgi:hypothetical protein
MPVSMVSVVGCVGGSLSLDDAALVGDDDELDAVPRAELEENAGDVGLGGEGVTVQSSGPAAGIPCWCSESCAHGSCAGGGDLRLWA